jgi:hypothetical protein
MLTLVTVAMMIGGAHARAPIHPPPVSAIARIVGAAEPNTNFDANNRKVVAYPRPTCHIDVDLSKNPIVLHTPGFVGITINSTTQICGANGTWADDYLEKSYAIIEEYKCHPQHGKDFEVMMKAG